MTCFGIRYCSDKAKVVYAPKEVYLPYGQPAVLDCHFRSNPPLTNLRWEKDGFLFDPYNVQVNIELYVRCGHRVFLHSQLTYLHYVLHFYGILRYIFFKLYFLLLLSRVFSIVVTVAYSLTVLMNHMVVAIHVHHTMSLAPRAHPR